MINTVTTRSDVESALSHSHAFPFSKSTTDIHDPIRRNFLQLSASYLGANMSSSQVESIINSHTAIHLNETGGIAMFPDWLYKISDRAFSRVKWTLTAMSGMITTSLIMVLES